MPDCIACRVGIPCRMGYRAGWGYQEGWGTVQDGTPCRTKDRVGMGCCVFRASQRRSCWRIVRHARTTKASGSGVQSAHDPTRQLAHPKVRYRHCPRGLVPHEGFASSSCAACKQYRPSVQSIARSLVATAVPELSRELRGEPGRLATRCNVTRIGARRPLEPAPSSRGHIIIECKAAKVADGLSRDTCPRHDRCSPSARP